MDAPRLRVVGTRREHAKRFKGDISALLTSVLKTEPGLSPQEAMYKVEKNLREKMEQEELENNPFAPPKDGRCIINALPVEILAHIFRVGVEMQREGGDDDEFEEVPEDGEEKEGLSREFDRLVEEEDDTSEEEDEGDGEDEKVVDMATIQLDDNNSEWEDEDAEAASGTDDEPMDSDSDADDDDSDTEDDEDDADEREPPFEILVSHVCRQWRETAVNTPDLWTHILIECSGPEQTHNWAEYQVYLERSKAQALHLDINIDCGCGDPNCGYTCGVNQEEIDKISSLILPKAAQWRFLSIKADKWCDARGMLEKLAQVPAAPILETLILENYEDSESTDVFEPTELKEPFYLPFHGNAPNLQEVVLCSVHIDWDGAVSMFQGLRSLELGYHTEDVRPSWRSFSSYLKNSPQLVHLELKESGPQLSTSTTLLLPPATPATGMPSAYYTAAPSLGQEDEDGDPYEWPRYPLEVPSVHEFLLRDQVPHYATALVTKLHFPNLKILSLELLSDDFTEFVETCCQPLRGVNSRRSLFQTIQTLDLHALGTVRNSAFESMTAALSGLKNLHLDCFDDEDSVPVPQTLWMALSHNVKAVLDAVKEKRREQNAAGISTTTEIAMTDGSQTTTSVPGPSADHGHTSTNVPAATSSLSIVPPSPSAALPPVPPTAAAAPTPSESATELLSSLQVPLLLPNLEGLRTRSIEGHQIRRFLNRRIKVGAPLKHLSIHDDDDVDEADERWFQQHLEDFGYYAETEYEDETDDEDEEDDIDAFDLEEDWEDEDGSGMDEDEDGDEDDEWEDESDGPDDDGDNDGDDDDDDEDMGGDDGEGPSRVQTRRGPSAGARRGAGAASSHVTTGLENLD